MARETIALRRDRLERYFGSLDPCRVALEAGCQSAWVSELIAGCGHEVLVANPWRLALISRSYRKTDKDDAEILARLGRADPALLSPLQHRSQEAQSLLSILRARDGLVRSRTALINQVRGLTKVAGARLLKCTTGAFAKQARPQVPTELLPALGPLLDTIEFLSLRILDYDRSVRNVAKARPATARLCQVAGVGSLTALAFALTIEDPHRFKNRRAVASYLGLVPKRQESGNMQPQLRITKAGNSYMRRLLVGSAQYILGPFGPDTDLRRWGVELMARGGKNAKRRAVVAVARKLSVLLLALWQSGDAYEPLKNAA